MKNENYPLYEVEPVSDLKELVNYAAEKYGDKPAFIFERNDETVEISYRQFKADVEALGTALYDMGIRGVKVAVIGENSYEWILTYFTVVNSGNVIVPLDKELPAKEVKNLNDHSEALVFVYSDTYADIAEFLRDTGSSIRHYISMGDLNKLVETGQSLIKSGDKSVVDYAVDKTALAALLYTSGTTGNPKGVMLSNKNIAKDAVSICQYILLPDRCILVLPLYHSSGFLGVLGLLIYGNAITINLSLKSLQSDFMKCKPRIAILVPLFIETFYKQLQAATGFSEDKELLKKVAEKVFGGELSVIVSGGAPLDKPLVEKYADLGITVLNVYGLTECAGLLSANRNQYYRNGSVGRVLPSCEVKIAEMDDKGRGEICVKGDIVMLGYYKNEQATKETFDGEWLKTGDIGYMDEDGFLYICGRKKNMILLSNGKNVYPEELEFALIKHIPYIKEAVVYAADNAIVAEVFLDTDNHPDCASRLDGDILSFNKTQAPFKNIGRTVIRDTEFPKTTTRKIKRQYN